MRSLLRWLGFLVLGGLALQLFFLVRIAAMSVVDPQSTAFQRSEAWQLTTHGRRNGDKDWAQEWVPDSRISANLKRAVVASEDGGFMTHHGVEWEAIERAYERNERAEAQAARRAAQAARRGKAARPAQLRGGSTITQQLAKNLFLSGERNLLRKGQELVIAVALEMLLDKRRILEIYLNSVEWGEGVFGAEAAAQRYFDRSAARLSASQAARLAVMLPSPKYYETRQGSGYLASRTNTIVARMPSADIP
ncbi:monofunctional biosynthetic peptidoglycan transglycosylase [Variovorax dokdonensis]|uniref:Biosynthetic peptidoglycan transglycosylase n=1 Tax=Variovorax dokdonensis TaxID=344883 RepID=A0ABT7NBF5_9BURK|nr:monofunctional biosynthetic peptidoglycan transglycosylase [Variovorax dokdonensis]MDM0045261.1 monofunctional biosynthetic peptidoglycan transglycosylase [Variovorax dokdonensis]